MSDLLDEVLGIPKAKPQTIEQATQESLPVGSQAKQAIATHGQELQGAQAAGAPIGQQAVDELLGQQTTGAYKSQSLPISNKESDDGTADFTTLVKAESVDDPSTKLKIYAKARFPNDPKALERYALTTDGKVVYVGENGKIYQENPQSKLKQFAATLGGQAAPILGGIVGGAVATPEAPMVGGAVGGAVGAAGGEGVRKIIGNLALDEPVDTSGVLKSMGIQAGFSLAGSTFLGGLAKGAEKYRTAADIKKLDPAQQADAERLVSQFGAERQGDPYTYLTPAERTNLGSLKGQQKTAFQMPTGQDTAQKFEDWRYGRSKQIFNEQLGNLSTETSPEIATVKASGAAQKILDAVNSHIQATGQEAYGDLWKQFKTIPQGEIQNLQQLASTPDFQEAAKRATKLAKNFQKDDLVKGPSLTGIPSGKAADVLAQFLGKQTGIPQIATTPEGLQMLRVALKEQIDENAARGIGKAESAATTGILAKVDGVLNRITGGAYQAANQQYGKLIEADEALKNGIVGTLSNVKDAKLQQLAANVFDPERSGPQAIKMARNAFVTAGHEQEWNDLSRSYIYLRMRDFEKPGVGQDIRITQPALWARDMFYDPDTRANLSAALTTAQFANFNALADLFKRTAVVPRGGSDTASKLYGAKQLEQEGRNILSKGVGIARQPLLSLQNGIDKLTVGDFASKLTDIITSPGATDKLRYLRTLKPNSIKMVNGLGSLLGVLSAPATSQEPAADIPPALLQQVQPGRIQQ